ncbi:hypothetical protein QBA38_38140, partial [Streptomyces stelliscabiei]|uniref:hypothetical protein n=1 Tax=Streptomyces stelliscabiei TaxID=146820 RepID=UPI002FF41F6D
MSQYELRPRGVDRGLDLLQQPFQVPVADHAGGVRYTVHPRAHTPRPGLRHGTPGRTAVKDAVDHLPV